jgi:hypothetical protein
VVYHVLRDRERKLNLPAPAAAAAAAAEDAATPAAATTTASTFYLSLTDDVLDEPHGVSHCARCSVDGDTPGRALRHLARGLNPHMRASFGLDAVDCLAAMSDDFSGCFVWAHDLFTRATSKFRL